MVERQGRTILLLLASALALVAVVHLETFVSVVRKWDEDSSFSHGYIVFPVVLWLAWRRRWELARTVPAPSWFGTLAVAGCGVIWVVARGTGVLVLEQFAVVGTLAAMVFAVLGPGAARVLTFPLGFMFFAVPFGRAIVPVLMYLTADIATAALSWSGVPIYRDHMYILIPDGRFEVARACSGLNFVTTGLVLGVLYAHLNFRDWRKRTLCVAAFVVIPILANGVRVYLTILVSYLTNMRFGPGAEHVTFGRVFFVAVLLAMIWIGRRWHEDSGTGSAVGPAVRLGGQPWRPTPGTLAPALVALVLVVAAPLYLSVALACTRARLADSSGLAVLPDGKAGWTGPQERAGAWRPSYEGSVLQRLGTYQEPGGTMPVDAFVAVYGLGTSLGTEMISYQHTLYPGERNSLAVSAIRSVQLPDRDPLTVREVMIPGGGSSMLVWSWFQVGDRSLTSGFAVKAWEAVAFVSRNANTERVVTLATPLDDGARERLQRFVVAHAQCVGSGFNGEACSG